jgi:hypothetical protein
MRFAIAGVALIMNALDNFTTFACLRTEVTGFEVYEANPLAAYGFAKMGLVPGLVFEMVLTTVAIGFLLQSRSFDLRVRLAILIAMAVLPAWAVVNNVQVMQSIGVPIPF